MTIPAQEVTTQGGNQAVLFVTTFRTMLYETASRITNVNLSSVTCVFRIGGIQVVK